MTSLHSTYLPGGIFHGFGAVNPSAFKAMPSRKQAALLTPQQLIATKFPGAVKTHYDTQPSADKKLIVVGAIVGLGLIALLFSKKKKRK